MVFSIPILLSIFDTLLVVTFQKSSFTFIDVIVYPVSLLAYFFFKSQIYGPGHRTSTMYDNGNISNFPKSCNF